MKNLSFILVCITCLFSGCSIAPYYMREQADIEKGTRFPSVLLWEVDSSLAMTWKSTYMKGVAIQCNINSEIQDRKTRKRAIQIVLIGVGSATGLATTGYSTLANNPSPKVMAGLSLFSATSVASSFGFIGEDERLPVLQQKLDKLSELRTVAQDRLTKLERSYSNLSLLADSLKGANKNAEYDFTIDQVYIEQQKVDVEQRIEEFLSAINDWNIALDSN